MQSLVFFNKEGDNLNFTYNQDKERWEGDLLFHENSDDTFKTIGLYTFERIRAFEYENIDNLKLKKFQLFNEYRFQFLGSSNFTQSIVGVELPNTDPSFYSKWIYGENFESKFPKGSQIKFDSQLFEFTNPLQTYTVVSTKKNGILILSNIDNQSFDNDYGRVLGLTSTYVNQTISGVNSIGFYNYITEDFRENFSEWSQPDFYDRFFNRRKLNLINTSKNDGIVTVKNKDLFDRVYYKYEFPKSSFTQSDDFTLKLTLKTEAPNVYTGSLKALGSRLYFGGNIPRVLKPGAVFTIPTSPVNYNFLTVDYIPQFLGNANLIFYPIESQVIWNNLVYECIQSHTWSATSSITPDDPEYWYRPKYVPLTSELITEDLFYAEVHLSSNVLSYTQSFTQSSAVTLASLTEKYKEEFKLFNLDLYYNNKSLHVDLLYPTNYCLVDFYLSSTGTQSYSSRKTIYEHSVEVEETIKTELNVDTNENFRYNIVFTDLDEYGFKILINKQVYQQEIEWVYENSKINVERTIDKTIRKWFSQWYIRLFVVGIKVKIGFTGGLNSQYYNTISLTTVYPNVPIDFEVEVGITADYYIEHSEIAFKDISNYLSLNINNKVYDITVATFSAQNYDISTTLSNWIDEYSETLQDFGIYVLSVSNTLIFRIKSQYQRLEYTIQVGKSGLPEEELYIVKQKFLGKFGALITSNEIILPESWIKYKEIKNQFTGVIKNNANVFPITLSDLPNVGDFGVGGYYDSLLDDLVFDSRIAFREDNLDGNNISDWLSDIVGKVFTIETVSNPSFYVKFTVDTLTATINYSSTTIRRYNVTITDQNGTLGQIINGKLNINYVGEVVKPPVGELISPTWSFEDEPFATGQIVGINNTVYPWNNQEYNLITLEPQNIILDYRGPFWSTTDPICEVSPYIVIGFSDGFGATGCITVTQSPNLGGEFTIEEYASSFLLNFGTTNSYTAEEYQILGNTNIQDIIYAPITENIYILGQKLTVIDANNAFVTDIVELPGLTGPIQLGINPISEYIYCLSNNGVYIVDPRLNKVETSLTFSTLYVPKKFEFNSNNGDFYLMYENSPISDIWEVNNLTSTPNYTLTFGGNILDLTFNPNENDMYYAISDNTIQRIEGSTRGVVISYQYSGLVSPLFYEPTESSIYIFDSSGLRKINNGLSFSFGVISQQTDNYFVFNNVLEQIVISQTNQFVSINTDGGLITSVNTAVPGQMTMNQYDGDVYQAAGRELKVLDTVEGRYKWSERFGGDIKKVIYNPSKNSIFGIIPSVSGIIEQSSVVELRVTLGISLENGPTSSIQVEDNLYGNLDPNYQNKKDTWLKVREYIRKPRENFNGGVPVDLVWKWVDDQTPELFLMDFSGDQLITTGSYSYLGTKPLTNIQLNTSPNKDITKRYNSEYQKTVFDEVIKRIDYIDSETNVKNNVEPVEIFIGYNSQTEGPDSAVLKLYKREVISFKITTSPTNYDIIQFTKRVDGYLSININLNSDRNFTTDENGINRGLRPGQILQVFVSDVTNTRNKYISNNNGISIKLKYVFNKSLVGEIIERGFTDEFTVIGDYPKVGKTTYLSVEFKILDREIGSFNVYGQTEIEDMRFKIELGNSGQLIAPEDTYIFKTYDINEQGIDWTFLNKKRKELLMVRSEIYSFIGSYKAIINAINYFGYNDLEFYEYYRNINAESKDYLKLFKVEIPDIFDNTVEGWTPNDFIKHTLPNPNFEDTNLFNLTFRITDKEGNNILYYSLEEVLIKLQGLKLWLQKNVIPLTHRILDITGRADFVGETTIVHRNYDTRIIKIKQDFSPHDFHLNEAYLMPINSGSTVYNCVIDFSVSETSLASEYFSLKIRTYQTYKEWQPFNTYNKGDKVQYYQQIYESAINNNRLKNPRKFDGVSDWSSTKNYNLGDYASYYRDIYQYIGTQSSYSIYGTYSISPIIDINTNKSFAKWIIMTEWKKSDYLPVQTLSEFRTATHSYNFTVDSNLDPFILIEVTSDNGYGQNYTNKKSYEIRGTKDLIDDTGKPDPMGPFQPIVLIESKPASYPTFSTTPTTIQTINGGDFFRYTITSDQKILKWEIDEIAANDCLIDVEIIPKDRYSASLDVRADLSSPSDIFAIVIKAAIYGGYVTTLDSIVGFVNKVVCPIITLETQPFVDSFSVGNINSGDSYTVSASANDDVTWEIINVTKPTGVTIDFGVNQVSNCDVQIQSMGSTAFGDFSFQIQSISQVYPSCVSISGVISGTIIQTNFYSSRVSIAINPYTSDVDNNSNDYFGAITETNIMAPSGKSVDLYILILSNKTNRYYLFISVEDPINDLIDSVEITNYTDTLSATPFVNIENEGITIPLFKAEIGWDVSGSPIQPPSCQFDLKINFL